MKFKTVKEMASLSIEDRLAYIEELDAYAAACSQEITNFLQRVFRDPSKRPAPKKSRKKK